MKEMMRSKVEEKFSQYYEKWIYQLQLYLQQLVRASRDAPSQAELQGLVSKLTTHHKEYYTEKWAMAREDVLAFFSSTWCTPLENAYSWLTGWKPSTAFRLIATLRKTGAGLADLSEEQLKKIEQLRVKIKYEETKVEREMERQQVSLADRKVVDLAKLAARATGDGGSSGSSSGTGQVVEVAVSTMAAGMERVMKAADCVRLKTLKGLLDLMSPFQSVELLAAVSMLQIQLRQWGRVQMRAGGAGSVNVDRAV